MTSPLTIASPLTLPNGSTLTNRFAKAAMSEQLADIDHLPTEDHVRLYRTWADGGTALLISGNVMIDGTALGEPGNVVLEDDAHLDAFAAWAKAGSAGGTQFWMQLNHPGRQAPRNLSREPVAPSDVQLKLAGWFGKPRVLTGGEIRELVNGFARSAALAQRAGFAGVQIHGAHGYLVSQFLSPLTNQRKDEWGGSLENRMRFLVEIVRAVRARTGPDFGLGVKLNSADFQRGGFSETESIEVVRKLGGESIDLLEISGGTYERAAMWNDREKSDSTRQREAYFVDYAEAVREAATMPVMLTGGFHTVDFMNEAIASSAVAMVGLARPLALQPEFPRRALAGDVTEALRRQPKTGLATLDKAVVGLWYQWQIWRIAKGKAPKPRASALSALRLLWFTLRAGRKRRKQIQKRLRGQHATDSL